MSCDFDRSKYFHKPHGKMLLRFLTYRCIADDPNNWFHPRTDVVSRYRDIPSIKIPFTRSVCSASRHPTNTLSYDSTTPVNREETRLLGRFHVYRTSLRAFCRHRTRAYFYRRRCRNNDVGNYYNSCSTSIAEFLILFTNARVVRSV